MRFGPASELIIPLDSIGISDRLSAFSNGGILEPAAVRLRLRDLAVFDQPAAAVRIFLDLDSASPSPDTPGYVDTFAFFPMPSGTSSGEPVGSFVVDLGDAATALRDSGRLAADGHTLTLVPIDAEGHPAGRIGLRAIEPITGG